LAARFVWWYSRAVRFTEEIHIDSVATKVFDTIADLRNEALWNGNISRAELTTGEPIGIGSKFILEDKRGEHETTITALERPRHIEFVMSSKEMDVAISYTFTEKDGTTMATGSFAGEPKGFRKFLLPLILPMIKREVKKQHVNLKDFCEPQTG